MGLYDSATGFSFSDKHDPADDKMIVVFSLDSALNEGESEKQGRPVYYEVEKITIIAPGQKNSEVVERVKDHHRRQYPRQYEAFKAGQEQVPDGMPVDQWPPLTKAVAQNLKALHIHTVEQLAALPDSGLSSIGMGARELREKAVNWLKMANDGKPLAEAQAQNELLKSELEVKGQQIESLQAAVAKLQEKLNG